MQMTNKEKVVFITGASSGIGRACAVHLAEIGMTVFAGVRRLEDGLRLQEDAHGEILPIQIDITVPNSVNRALETAKENLRGRRFWGLVNNAGIPLGDPTEFLPIEDLRQGLEVNLIGHISVTQAFLPLLRKFRGRIVNMSSQSGIASFPFMGPYAATKFALEGITDALRMELRPWRIAVSLIEPGEIATELWDKGAANMNRLMKIYPPEALQLYGPVLEVFRKLTQHGTKPEEVAHAVAHALVSNRPKIRYLVGKDAIRSGVTCHLPSRMKDWVILRQLPQWRNLKM